MSAALVELRGITRRFGETTEVLRGVDLDIGAEDTLAVLGPSGCGKSTLLHILGSLLPPTSGTARFDGRDLATMSATERAALRNREIGFVFQAHHLLPQCTALENVLVPTLVHPKGELRDGAEQRARDLLLDVGLGERLDHRPAQMSGGEQQRVAVVRALINRPRLLLADEPTGSLDETGTDLLGDLLCTLNEKHRVAVVTVTHSPRLARRMQRVVELHEGRIRDDAGERAADATG